tara:strand:+ start:130 stop:780 length:651 start_codon:yes stop_codon:yes gene_type:complete
MVQENLFSKHRRDYTKLTLSKSELRASPFQQFQNWFHDIEELDNSAPNAMTLSTSTLNGKPSSRIVLLKSYDNDGFVFFTNYDSRKGKELIENPQASLLFYWIELEREVRIEGNVQKVTREESLTYFHNRPRESQLGAWASLQSRPLENREELDQRYSDYEKQFKEKDIPLPNNWGGFRLIPSSFEFFQGRSSRLHDRFLYQKEDKGTWEIVRLNP